MKQSDAVAYMNYLGKAQRPFLFIIDFEKRKPMVIPLDQIQNNELQYHFPSGNNAVKSDNQFNKPILFSANPPDFDRYSNAFDLVQKHLHGGDSYLLNLTLPSRLRTNLSTQQIFTLTKAPYRLWWKDHFTCFSPESFVRIEKGKIYSYPMKGTIDADLPNAPKLLLANPKEKAEHATIVDLIRNDLSQVASRVRVKRFRYLEKIQARRGAIWQSSSEISGNLATNYHEQIGDLIFRLLPAGSISGAPKRKTVEIIQAAENYERGYYTGVAGIFDGQNLDSAVLIRFIEESPQGLFFKSGGGITTLSKVEEEYQELIRKVDLPIAKSEKEIAKAIDGIRA